MKYSRPKFRRWKAIVTPDHFTTPIGQIRGEYPIVVYGHLELVRTLEKLLNKHRVKL